MFGFRVGFWGSNAATFGRTKLNMAAGRHIEKFRMAIGYLYNGSSDPLREYNARGVIRLVAFLVYFISPYRPLPFKFYSELRTEEYNKIYTQDDP